DRAHRVTEHVRLDDVVKFLDERLEISKFDEVESNGLIVRASDVVTSVAAAVSTSFHAISRAKSAQADLLIAHHRSWPEIDLELVEEKHTRLRQNGISLYGAHSALDGAPGISNGDGIAAARGADTYVTGEITMYTRMYAKERKINLVAGSHYATETFGVRALAQLVEARFGIAWTFVPESSDVY